jgi:hypothetical protein
MAANDNHGINDISLPKSKEELKINDVILSDGLLVHLFDVDTAMIRLADGFLVALVWLAVFQPARADHFTIDLDVKGPKANRTVHTETLGLGVKPKPRTVLEVQAGDTLTIKWTLASTSSNDTVKDVLIHFYAVKINKAGDPPPPKLDKDVLLESALTMDFKPKDKSEGELTLQVAKPGTYLLRLETIRAAGGANDHEHFANLDLIAR